VEWVLTTANPQLTDHEAEINVLQTQVADQAALTAALQSELAATTAYVQGLQSYVTVDATTDPVRPVVIVSGANLQVVNGLGSTPTATGRISAAGNRILPKVRAAPSVVVQSIL